MPHYLIEFRFQGRAKKDFKRLIYGVDKKFGLKNTKRKRPVPHITIVAPFFTKNQKRLVKDFKESCERHPLMRFDISGYGNFDKTKVVYADIEPSKEMIAFRKELIKKLKHYCILKSTDIISFLGFRKIRSYTPHATIAKGLDKNRFEKIKNYLDKKKKFNTKDMLARATLIKGNKILYEYDFLLGKLLNRKEAKSKKLYSKTVELLKNK